MAIGAVYSGQEWRAAIKAETTLGTRNVATMQLINLDFIFDPTEGGNRVADVRSGVGNTVKGVDYHRDIKMAVKEFVIGGIADQTVLPMLISNVVTTAVGSSPASYDLAFNYTAPALTNGATFSDNTATFTIAWIPPDADKIIIYGGCVVTNLVFRADHLTDGGRVHFEATFQTGYVVLDGQSAPSSMTAYPSTFYFIYDMTTTTEIGNNNEVVMNGFDMNISNPTMPKGRQGSNGDPELIARGLPAPLVRANFNVLYDDNTAGLPALQAAGTVQAVEMSNHATWASASTFGFRGLFGRLDEITMDPAESGMALNVPIDFLASTTGDIIQIIA